MSKTIRFTMEVDFITDDTSAVDACARELESAIDDTIHNMFNVLGLPSFWIGTDIFDNESGV